jgi:branched-chain amino acid transport system ATP-binding protein
MDDQVTLSVNNISISFGGIQALMDVSINVKKEEILGLIGPNGAGKTVLLNCINGVYKPEKGAIIFRGQQINGLARHKIAPLGIARTFQQIELFRQMNVIENTLAGSHFKLRTNVFSGGFFWGPGKKLEIKAREEAEEILDFLELYPYRKQKVGSLSFGIQKLVGLARAMAMDPKMLLLDEIASGLNREEKEDLARFLLRIQYEKKIPMIWVEHDLEMITQLADRIVCLNYGQVVAEGSPKEVTSNPLVIEAYLGSSNQSWMTQPSALSL